MSSRRKEQSSVLKGTTLQTKNKKFKSKSIDYKESKNSCLRTMKDLREKKTERDINTVKVVVLAMSLVVVSLTLPYSDNIFSKEQVKKKIQL